MEKYLKEVRSALQKVGKGRPPVQQSYYNSEIEFIAAIPVPIQRKIHLAGFSFSDASHTEQSKIWNYIWNNARYSECMSQALLYFQYRRTSLTLTDWRLLKSWVTRIDNWAHSDSLSDLYSHLHERYPAQIYPGFSKWNKSSKPWERRQSVVSLFYYSSSRKIRQPAFSRVLPLVKRLLHDEHYYVQKGVGWTIRESYNVYPKRTLAFISDNAAVIAPAAWQAATEKLSKKDKARIKSLRGKTVSQ